VGDPSGMAGSSLIGGDSDSNNLVARIDPVSEMRDESHN